MKKTIRIAAAAALALILLLPYVPTLAAGPLDEIKNYTITADLRQDGTLNIQYHLDWMVLDDTSEGPLTWVKVGIANSHVDSIQAVSPNIAKIGYLGDGGSYVRIDFDRAYHAGETVSFDFTLHQAYMYTLDGAGACSYSFTPGWFDGTNIDSFKILWNKENVASSDASGSEGNYLMWQASLGSGETRTAHVQYPVGAFIVSEGMQASQNNEDDGSSGAAVGFTIFFVAIVAFIIYAAKNNRYKGGFGGGVYHGATYHSACACASSCACACACACAGGGRAGCSAKNFYGAGIDSGILERKLKQK